MGEHKHPITEPSVKVEKVDFINYGSEGCEEHYDTRVVTPSPYAVYEKIGAKKMNPYLKAMVIGEVLSVPRSKKCFKR